MNFGARSEWGPCGHGASMSHSTSSTWRCRRLRAGTRGTPGNLSVPQASRQNSVSAASLPFVLYLLGRWDGKRYEECGSVFCRSEHSHEHFRETNAPASHPPIPIYGLNSALWGGTPEGTPSVPAFCPEFRPRDGGRRRYARGQFELATLTLANNSGNRVNIRLCSGSFDSWSGPTRH